VAHSTQAGSYPASKAYQKSLVRFHSKLSRYLPCPSARACLGRSM